MKNSDRYTYEVYDIKKDITTLIMTLNKVQLFTGYNKGYIANYLNREGVRTLSLGGIYLITRRDRLPTDHFIEINVVRESVKLPRHKVCYDILIHEEDGMFYYIDCNKNLKKTTRHKKSNFGHEFITHHPVTNEDYKRFDLDALYYEKFTKWREKFYGGKK